MALPVLNINVGVLGHVDSGKTSLVRALSTSLSTAALDKHPQSAERGITLDLGFSSFTVGLPLHLARLADRWSALQFTLVDCPGHASLIRTVIGGAQIIDMVLLVIDITKGIQTQTAECLVIAEVSTDKMIVVLNKVDMLPEEAREKKIDAASQRVRKALAATRFAAAPFVVLSAAPGGGGKLGAAAPVEGSGGGSSKAQAGCVSELVAIMSSGAAAPARRLDGPFLFAVDHCFPIKGQGTVLTGTALAGRCRVGDVVELPGLRQERKIKSIQMFRRPVDALQQGDRAGICVTNLDAALVERGLLCSPGSGARRAALYGLPDVRGNATNCASPTSPFQAAVPLLHGAVALVRKIRFFKARCASESKFHVTVGHTTVLATAVFFGARELASRRICDGGRGLGTGVASAAGATSAVAGSARAVSGGAAASDIAAAAVVPGDSFAPPPYAFDWSQQHEWQDELLGPFKRPGPSTGTGTAAGASAAPPPPPRAPGCAEEPPSLPPLSDWQWCALLFESPVLSPAGCRMIASHLDADVHAATCRLAFEGSIVEPLASSDIHELHRLNLTKLKTKQGVCDRLDDSEGGGGGGGGGVTIIARSLFKKETDMSQFIGLRVHTRAGQLGRIVSSFGKSGKFKAHFPDLGASDPAFVEASSGAGAAGPVPPPPPPPIRPGDPIFLRYRKRLFDPHKEKGVKRIQQ